LFAALSMAQAQLNGGLIRPVLHESWMRNDLAIVKLRRRPLGPAASALLPELQHAYDESLVLDHRLCQAWDRRIAARQQGGGAQRRAAGRPEATGR
jgi:hypothetical protein